MTAAPELRIVRDEPPHDATAEQAVLGACLLGGADAVRRAAAILKPADFFAEPHGVLFRALVRMAEGGAFVDPLTIRVELEQRGELRAAGDVDLLSYLLDMVPNAAGVEAHSAIVRERAERRKLLDAGRELMKQAADGKRTAAEIAASMVVVIAGAASGAAPRHAAFPVVRVLDGEAPAPPAVQVDDLLVDRDVNEWAGHGGAAKSVLALLLAICVALGRDVFGTLAVRRSGPVLIVAPEDGVAAVRMMLDAIAEGLALDATDRATLAARLFIVPDSEAVDLCTDTRRLRDTAKACGAVLVVLDPLRNLLGGADENDNALAGAVLDALRRDVCRDAGAAVLILHHSRKPGKEQGPDVGPSVHEMRGAGAWAAGARLVFGVTNKAGRVTMTALKANRLRSDLRHELRLEIEADPAMPTRWLRCEVTDLNRGLDSESYTPGLARALTPNEQTALGALDDAQEPGTRLSWSTWLRRSGLKDDTFNKIKSRLVSAGLALSENTGKHTPRGGPIYSYGITDTGRAMLARHQVSP